MITSLSRIGDYLSQIELHANTTKCLLRGMASSEKILRLVLPYFKTGSSLFFLGYASRELCCETRTPSYPLNTRVSPCNESSLPDKQAIAAIKDFSTAHGIFFIGTGICSALEALHGFSLVNLGRAHAPIVWAGTGLFLFANLVALQQNIAFFKQASEMLLTNEKDKRLAENMIKSAVLGIISNLGYVTATSVAILGAPTAIALLIGCISAFFGGLKILHDFYYFYLQNNLPSQPLLPFWIKG